MASGSCGVAPASAPCRPIWGAERGFSGSVHTHSLPSTETTCDGGGLLACVGGGRVRGGCAGRVRGDGFGGGVGGSGA
jgi:hypothetical protein